MSRNQTKLRHTITTIPTVGKFDLEPGNTYLIQHSKEGIKGIDPKDKNITPAKINDYNTRFSGKFVRYDTGKTETYPNGIPGITNMEVAVFEDVKIEGKNKNKNYLTDDIYVIISVPGKPDRGKSFIDLPGKNTVKGMLDLIKSNKVAFGVNKWIFADAATEIRKRIETTTMGHLVYDTNPNKLQYKVFRTGREGPAETIAEYLGTEIPDPSHETLARRAEERAAYNQVYGNASTTENPVGNEITTEIVGNKRKFDEVGGRRRTRRNRRNKKGKTRKGKTRKGRTMKHRRHYRK
jgi:hypothetical protein